MSKRKDDFETEDIEFNNEEAELETIEANSVTKIKKLRTELKRCEEEKRNHLENLQRAKADFLNAKKRLDEDLARDRERAINSLIEQLLPICDSFAMAKGNTELWESVSAEWRSGVEGISNQVDAILTSYGVKPIDPTGQKFNPTRHEAVANVPVDKPELDNTVVTVIQLGYERTVGERTEVLRPARVTVGELG